MSKFGEFIKSFFAGIGADILIDQGGNIAKEGLDIFYAKNPKACSALVTSLYVWIDTVLEELADKSGTKLDDKAIDEAKKELEAFAAEKGFTLTNLDND